MTPRKTRGVKWLCWLLPVCTALAAETRGRWFTDPTVQTKFGVDSNPQAATGPDANIAGGTDHFTQSVGAGFGAALLPESADGATLKVNYAGETVRFAGLPAENFSQHRLGGTGRGVVGGWTLSGEGSALFVDGSRDTLASTGYINANGLVVWRERRRQWQHRVRLQAQREWGSLVARGGATWLNYDYDTKVVPGWLTFADRSDRQVSADAGWRSGATSLWLAGVRAGRQEQAIVPLPNCEFEYSANYRRLAVGWEGRLPGATVVALSLGPDFRHFTGAIDPRVFTGGRDRTSLWVEGSAVAKPNARCTLTGKVTRMSWLSSTGKSALMDTSVEAAALWTLNPVWGVRVTGKLHESAYFPSLRDDRESLAGAGVSLKLTKSVQLTADALRHRGWNTLGGLTGRDFNRAVFSLGAAMRL